MISSFKSILELKKLMLLMEADLGIEALSDEAKTLLVAIADVQNPMAAASSIYAAALKPDWNTTVLSTTRKTAIIQTPSAR